MGIENLLVALLVVFFEPIRIGLVVSRDLPSAFKRIRVRAMPLNGQLDTIPGIAAGERIVVVAEGIQQRLDVPGGGVKTLLGLDIQVDVQCALQIGIHSVRIADDGTETLVRQPFEA